MQIEIHQLHFAYRSDGFELNLPSLSVAEGSHYAMTGPSGCGKSTLLRLLAGINLPDSGEVRLGGQITSALSTSALKTLRISRIGFVFQDFHLIDYLNVRENIRLPFRLHPALDWDTSTARRLDRLAERAGIAPKLDEPVTQLSQGERQRVALCRALIHRPRLILADEPTGNLDTANKHRIVELLLEEARSDAATVVMVTHDDAILDRFDEVGNLHKLETPAPA